MLIYGQSEQVREAVKAWKKEGKSVGFVPTMGYLHEGHKSLIDAARRENDKVVVSIFVNPMQFGPAEDLDSYPRDLNRDAKLCEDAGVDIIFHPEPEQIVYKANDYFEKIDEEKNSKVEWIIPNAQTRSMEPVRLTLHPGGSSEIYLPQECEEFGYVIKGTVKLCYGGKVHTVKAGESFYFKAGKKHFIENKSSKDAMLIWVSNPPSF